MIPPMNHSNYRLPVLPANGRAGSRLKSFVMTCSLIFAAAGFCLAATNCSNGNKTSDTPPALSFETTSKTLEVGETYRPTLRIRHDGDANDTAYDMDGNPLGVTFRSSSPQTVSVNARGIVTGRNVGTATVTAETAETASGDARCAIGITVRSSNTTWIDAPLSDGIIFSRFVQLPANTVMQGFDVDSRGEIFYTQVTDRYKILVSRSMPDRQATEYMTLCFHGHSSNMAVEEAGDERFVWVGNYANRVDDGNYWHEQVVSRIRYNPGSTHYPWNSDENYFIEAGCLNMNPAVDAANDQLAILYTRVDTPGRYCWVVYSLSEAKALPEETVTLQPLSYGELSAPKRRHARGARPQSLAAATSRAIQHSDARHRMAGIRDTRRPHVSHGGNERKQRRYDGRSLHDSLRFRRPHRTVPHESSGRLRSESADRSGHHRKRIHRVRRGENPARETLSGIRLAIEKGRQPTPRQYFPIRTSLTQTARSRISHDFRKDFQRK